MSVLSVNDTACVVNEVFGLRKRENGRLLASNGSSGVYTTRVSTARDEDLCRKLCFSFRWTSGVLTVHVRSIHQLGAQERRHRTMHTS